MFTLSIYFIALNVYVEFVLIYRPHPVLQYGTQPATEYVFTNLFFLAYL